MKAKLTILLSLVSLLWCTSTELKAQQDTTMYRVETVDGIEYDFGLLIPTNTGGQLIAIPWLGVTFPFGNSKKTD